MLLVSAVDGDIVVALAVHGCLDIEVLLHCSSNKRGGQSEEVGVVLYFML